MRDDLIFDLGLHRGEDTEFYLAKGFRVVAVEANRELCADVSARLAQHVASGALTVVNMAISDQPGEVTFYADDRTQWGTVDPTWADRNLRLGSHNRTFTVSTTSVANLVEEHGVPYFAKIDIEGMDMVALRGFALAPERPRYVSIESDKVSFRALREEFQVMTDLGYDQFKLVSQLRVPRQKLPNPPREGRYVATTFVSGSSGAFGEETPGEWVSADEAIEAYRSVFLQYALTGDEPFIRSMYLRNALKLVWPRFRNHWYDTHARRSGA